MAASERFSSSLKEILTCWTIDEVMNANDVLDIYDELEAKSAKAAKASSRGAR